MFIRHSIKNILRSWKKTTLFFVLIVLLVLILCIGLSLTVTITDFLAQCDENYTTIGVFEYIGAAYPDETVYDPGLADFAASFDTSIIEDNECVQLWDSSAIALGYSKGISFVNQHAPQKNRAVLIVQITGRKESEEVYSGIVADSLYSFDSHRRKMVYVNSMGTELEIGRYYLLHGEFYLGQSSYKYFKVWPFVNTYDTQDHRFGSNIKNMIVDVTNDDGSYSINPDSWFHDAARTYEVINNSVTVYASSAVEDLFPFQQETLYLVSGRNFSQNEYDAGEQVCIISEFLAENLGVGIGDSFNLSIATASGCTLTESYWNETGFTYEINYTVVGIFNTHKEWISHVFIPKSDAVNLESNHFSYTLGQATIINDKAEQFLAEISQQLPERVRLTVYDQGYSAISKPLNDILRTAMIITGISIIAVIVFIALFGFLFVYRQRDVAATMLRLGARRHNVFTYFLFGSGMIALFASAAGSVIGKSLSGSFVTLVNQVVSEYTANDLRFSNSNLSIKKAVALVPEINAGVFIIIAFCVFLLAILSCFIFAKLSTTTHTKKQRYFSLVRNPKSCFLCGGSLKYALLSMWRGNLRSLIAVVVAFSAVVLLCQLTSTMHQYRAKLEDVKSNAKIRGYFTDVYGQQMYGLSLDGIRINEVFNCGYISDICVTKSFGYSYVGSTKVNGEEVEIPTIQKPTTSFANETLVNKISQGPRVIFTNNIKNAPEFIYSSSITTEFLEGYDQSVLSQDVGEVLYCLVTTSFMQEHGIHPGDTIRLTVLNSDRGSALIDIDFLVVGSYVKEGQKDNIYCQLGGYIQPSILFASKPSEPDMARLYYSSFHSAIFQLNDSSVLSDFKAFLYEKGYSEISAIRQVRNFIVIEDNAFLSTESSLSQRIWYMERIFPVLYILIEALALFVSYMLIQIRKKEIAIMRGLGTSKRVTFMSLFIEQLILCLAGSLLGLVLSGIVFQGKSPLGFTLSVVFVLCWFIGAAISIMRMNWGTVISILHDEE